MRVTKKKNIYHYVKGQGHRKHENHYLSHNFWTGSRRDFWLVSKCSLSKYLSEVSHSPHDAWRSVFASHDVNSEPIDFKIGTHIDFTCTIYHIKNCTNKNNITCITMATKYPIIKHRAFFKTLISAYHPFILDGFLWNFAYEISLK